MGHGKQIDDALAVLADAITEELSAAGWSRRMRATDPTDATIVLPVANGVLAVLRVGRSSFGIPDRWPVDVTAASGAGYEPALDLMPLLTLTPRAALVGNRPGQTVELSGPDSVPQVARRIADLARSHAGTVARDYPDATAIDDQLRHRIDEIRAAPMAENDDDSGATDWTTRQRLVLLASTGRHHEARTLLAAYPDRRGPYAIDRDDRRFIRQLTRWLDAGGPVPPPVDQTLALLPRRAHPERTSWSQAQAQSKTRKEALDAVRVRAAGKTLDELSEAIAAEYAARGLEIAPSAVDLAAEMLHTEQQPFGRMRSALAAIQLATAAGADMVRLIGRASDEDPSWLQPPDRAAFPMVGARRGYVGVDVDPAARDWLDQVRREAPRRMARTVLVDVWLTREQDSGHLAAWIGNRRIGTIPAGRAAAFDEVLSVAAMFDEDPYAQGRLTADGSRSPILEVPMPQGRATDPPPA